MNYKTEAMKFAKYGEQSEYPFLALAEEAGEVLGKIAKFIRKNNVSKAEVIEIAKNPDNQIHWDLVKELGDVQWQIAACCKELDIDFDSIELRVNPQPNPFNELYYDAYNVLHDELKTRFQEINEVQTSLTQCCEAIGVTVEFVQQYNLDKLSGREERGTIVGVGDER